MRTKVIVAAVIAIVAVGTGIAAVARNLRQENI